MNKQLFFPVLGLAVICLAIFTGCEGGGSSSATATSNNGFQYTHHIQKNGVKPQPGDQVYFHYQVFLDDSLLQASYGKQQPNLRLPTPEEIKLQPDPVVDVLSVMSVGDSITVVQSLDSLPQRPPGFEKFDNLVYSVTLYDIKSEEDYKLIAEEEQKEREAELAKQYEDTKVTGEQFLAENKTKAGVKTTASGLQYLVIKEGTGKQPSATSNVEVHYHGTTPEGVVFDSSVDRGESISFFLNQVIPGWTEGVQLMKEGAKYKFFIPQELAYGANAPQGGQGPIKPFMPLVFEVELIKVN